jgi:hypothetical protein
VAAVTGVPSGVIAIDGKTVRRSSYKRRGKAAIAGYAGTSRRAGRTQPLDDENSLHWVMDMIFRDDECRIRTNHAPANFATIKHIAHNLSHSRRMG